MSPDHITAPGQTGQVVLDNVPGVILHELQKLADLNGTSVSREAAKIVESYLCAETGEQPDS